MFEYDETPINHRPLFRWPGGASVAAVVTVAVEAWDRSTSSAYPGGPPILPIPSLAPGLHDANWSWREYGLRVGLWRVFDLLDRLKIRASAAVNGMVIEKHPAIIEELKRRQWEIVPHGYQQGVTLADFAGDPEGHRAYVDRTLDAFTKALGHRPDGWISSSMVILDDTPTVLAERGVRWMADFVNDDQPFELRAGQHRLIAMPYSVELNDYAVLTRGHQSPEEYSNALIEQFEVLREEAERTGSSRMMNVGFHPHVMGQPFRIRWLSRALEHIQQSSSAWFATRSEIADHFALVVRKGQPAGRD